MVAIAPPMTENWLVNELIAPLMFSAPIASMTSWTAFDTRLPMLSIAVPMPCVESFACWANDAKESPPSLSSVIIMELKSLIDIVPSLSAS